MKKLILILSILLALALCFSLTACNKDPEEPKNTPEETPEKDPHIGDVNYSDSFTEGLVFVLNEDGSSYSVKDYSGSDTEVVIPKIYKGYYVTSIGGSAFYQCSSLTSVTIPDSVTSIGSGEFVGCFSLTSITVDSSNPAYKSIDGNLYSKDGKILIQYAIGKTDTSFVIPNSVTRIGKFAFSDSSFTNITIPYSVTIIGQSAFSSCDSLTSVTIGNSVTCFGNLAFSSCSSLTSINYNGTKAQWNSIETGYMWWYNLAGYYTVHCTDGDIGWCS